MLAATREDLLAMDNSRCRPNRPPEPESPLSSNSDSSFSQSSHNSIRSRSHTIIFSSSSDSLASSQTPSLICCCKPPTRKHSHHVTSRDRSPAPEERSSIPTGASDAEPRPDTRRTHTTSNETGGNNVLLKVSCYGINIS
jgi:hypothetical protein